jgi:hypothetical protein
MIVRFVGGGESTPKGKIGDRQTDGREPMLILSLTRFKFSATAGTAVKEHPSWSHPTNTPINKWPKGM